MLIPNLTNLSKLGEVRMVRMMRIDNIKHIFINKTFRISLPLPAVPRKRNRFRGRLEGEGLREGCGIEVSPPPCLPHQGGGIKSSTTSSNDQEPSGNLPPPAWA